MYNLSVLQAAVYIGLMNRGLSVPVLSRMGHMNWRQAGMILDMLEDCGIRWPYEAVEPEREMDDAERQALEQMVNGARIQAGLESVQKIRKGSAREVTERLQSLDTMSGQVFEEWCGALLAVNDFTDVEVTRYSGDAGVDILTWKNGEKWAVQCKRYVKNVGNSAVQEVVAGMGLYQCQKSLVITNSWYTSQAKKLAAANGTVLWDRLSLRKLLTERFF